MKFVLKDRGETAENSSGGGSVGVLKETVFVVLAYVAMFLALAGILVASGWCVLWFLTMTSA